MGIANIINQDPFATQTTKPYRSQRRSAPKLPRLYLAPN